ncbi:hypothetical protein CPB85DRAFT_845029 [Mucidula mucida]|nr:hypothetical protein CPB85DRAFT_845029 [Mucidula mucida]
MSTLPPLVYSISLLTCSISSTPLNTRSANILASLQLELTCTICRQRPSRHSENTSPRALPSIRLHPPLFPSSPLYSVASSPRSLTPDLSSMIVHAVAVQNHRRWTRDAHDEQRDFNFPAVLGRKCTRKRSGDTQKPLRVTIIIRRNSARPRSEFQVLDVANLRVYPLPKHSRRGADGLSIHIPNLELIGGCTTAISRVV